jgi:hypothetical protein
MTTLLQHIESLNAQAQAWMDSHPGDWCSMYTDDMSHWADMGIYTVEDFKRNQLINGISDASKDLYGCRMRLAWDEMSIEEMEETYENICKQLRLQFEEEEAAAAFEAELKKGLPQDCEPLPYEEYQYLENV